MHAWRGIRSEARSPAAPTASAIRPAQRAAATDAEAHAERAVRARDDPAEVRLPRVDRDRDALATREVRAGEHERLPVREAQDRGRADCRRG